MSYSISNLLIRNLRDVFGENDPTRRRAAIDEIVLRRQALHSGGQLIPLPMKAQSERAGSPDSGTSRGHYNVGQAGFSKTSLNHAF